MKKTKTLPLFVFLGAALEYFDFLLFPLLSAQLIQIYFQGFTNIAALNTLFLYPSAVGKFLGGSIFGYFADRFGRQIVIKVVPLCMIVATALMASIPKGFSFDLYLWVFAILRLLQSLSFGAEISTASLYAYELSAQQKPKNISFVFLGATIGAVCATGFLSALNRILSPSAFLSWGWKLPFVIATLVGLVSFILRRHVHETLPQKNHTSFLKILTSFKAQIFKSFMSLLVLILPVTLITLNLYFPLYLSKLLQFPISNIYSAQLIGLLSSGVFVYLAGALAQKFQFKVEKAVKWLLVVFFVFCPAIKPLIATSLVGFMVIWQFFISFLIVYCMQVILSRFPIISRGFQTGFIYNLSFVIASFIPMMIQKDLNYLSYLGLVLGCVAFIGLSRMKKSPS